MNLAKTGQRGYTDDIINNILHKIDKIRVGEIIGIEKENDINMYKVDLHTKQEKDEKITVEETITCLARQDKNIITKYEIGDLVDIVFFDNNEYNFLITKQDHIINRNTRIERHARSNGVILGHHTNDSDKQRDLCIAISNDKIEIKNKQASIEITSDTLQITVNGASISINGDKIEIKNNSSSMVELLTSQLQTLLTSGVDSLGNPLKFTGFAVFEQFVKSLFK